MFGIPGKAAVTLTPPAAKAIARGDVNAINYFVAQKYVEALKDIATSPNQKVFMMPVEATGILGAIAGVAAVAGGREALGAVARHREADRAVVGAAGRGGQIFAAALQRGQRTRRDVIKQRVCGSNVVEHGFDHAVMQKRGQRATFCGGWVFFTGNRHKASHALDAHHITQATVTQNIGGLRGPRRNRAQTRRDDEGARNISNRTGRFQNRVQALGLGHIQRGG